jgi:hypothetical protein
MLTEPPSFANTSAIWTLPSPQQQRAAVATLLQLPDGALRSCTHVAVLTTTLNASGPGTCEDAIVLDCAYDALRFANKVHGGPVPTQPDRITAQAGLHRTQTRVFYEIFQALLDMLRSPSRPGVTEAAELLRAKLTAHMAATAGPRCLSASNAKLTPGLAEVPDVDAEAGACFKRTMLTQSCLVACMH